MSLQLEEVICVQLGLEWFRLSTRWFRRKYSLLTQTTMLLRVLRFQFELFRHPFQVGHQFSQLLNLSTTVDICVWKEALLELNTPLVVLATKFVSSNQRREVNTPYLHTAKRVIKSSICVCSICVGPNFFLIRSFLCLRRRTMVSAQIKA